MAKKVPLEYIDYMPKKERAMSMKEAEKYPRTNVGIQTITSLRNYIPPAVASSHRLALMDFPQFLYLPRTIFFLFLGFCVLMGISLNHLNADSEYSASLARGLKIALSIVIFYAAVYFPDTMLNRPHPILWRIVQGLGVAICLVVVFIMILNLDTAREVLHYFDPEIGHERPDLIAIQCVQFINIGRLLWKLIGNAVRVILFRDIKLIFLAYALFGVLQVTLGPCVPALNPCSFDIEGLVCFALGTGLGYAISRYWDKHSMAKRKRKTSRLGNLLELFHPNVWWKHDWNALENPIKYVNVVYMLFESLLIDSNYYILKQLLFIPDTHSLFLIRAVALMLISVICINDLRFGGFSCSLWILTTLTVCELTACVKFAISISWSLPYYAILTWGAIISAVLVGFIIVCIKSNFLKEKPSGKPYNPYNPPVDIEYLQQYMFYK